MNNVSGPTRPHTLHVHDCACGRECATNLAPRDADGASVAGGEEVTLTTEPGVRTHWGVDLFIFGETLAVREGEQIGEFT